MAGTYASPAAIIVISVLFPLLGVIAVSLRIYTRTKAKLRLWVDDWFIIIALILEFILAGLLIWGAATRSLGEKLPAPTAPGPMAYLFTTTDQQIRLQQIQYFFDFIGVFTFGLTKLSILFLYRKLFCCDLLGPSTFSKVTLVMIGLVTAWTITFGFGAIFLCGAHPTYAWAPVAVVAEKCSAQLTFLEGYAISDFIMDVLIWSLPIPKIMTLRLTTQRKIAVLAVFLVGLLTIAASATRMGIYIRYIVNAFAQSDGETLITYLLFWTMIECGLGVVVACLPTIRPLFIKLSFGSVFTSIGSVISMRFLSQSNASTTGNDVVRLDSARGSAKNSSSTYSNYRGAREEVVPMSVINQDDLESGRRGR